MCSRIRKLAGWPGIASVVLLLLPAELFAQQKSVVDVGSKSQLFVDQELVHESRGISYSLHRGKKFSHGPILVNDQPCEGWGVQLYGTVIYDRDEKIFKMWYLAMPSDYFDHEVTLYATSRDGIHWDKAPIGTIKSKNGKPHNAVSHNVLASVVKDDRDPNPSRRYKMTGFQYDRGYISQVSPDGLHWTELSSQPMHPISYMDDVITLNWLEPYQTFITFAKQGTPVMGRQRRTFYSSTSRDFDNWTRLEPAFVADRRDDLGSRLRANQVRPLLNRKDNFHIMRTEFYGIGTYAAESCVVAFPWIFTVTANGATSGAHEGPIEVQFASSRDLVHWNRPFRNPIIEMGKPGDWESGMQCTASYAIDHGDEVRLYYWGAGFTHDAPIFVTPPSAEQMKKYPSGIGLATWQRDRFVSADASSDGAELTTVPIQFSGQRLEVNARVKPEGSLIVELLDTNLRPLAAWPASNPLSGDQLRHVVEFGEAREVSPLAGKPIALRFRMKKAELFAFAFRK